MKSDSVAGKLSKHYEFWESDLAASSFVLSIVKHGYKLPFVSNPPPFYARPNASSLRNKTFVQDSIVELLRKRCIRETSNMPFCCNPLTVADKGKLRLVIDLRHVNSYLKFPTFKYEDLRTAKQHLDSDYFFVTFDLKSGYHHVPINVDYQNYLGFSWTFDSGVTRYFVFVVLPFGLASACYVFTKVMRPLVKKWRNLSIKSTMYIDDGISSAKTFAQTLEDSLQIRSDLEKAGLTVNSAKSNFVPSQTGSWLGFQIDTRLMKFFVPQEKIDKLSSLLSVTLHQKSFTARSIAKIAGHLLSMKCAIGPIVRLFTRQMYKFVESRYSWDSSMASDEPLRDELKFWLRNLRNANGYQIKDNHVTSKIIFSDASDSGYGGYLVQRLGNVITRGDFVMQEQATSSTHRELLAVKNVLLSVHQHIKNEAVLWFSDNANVARIIDSGSTKPCLQNLAIDIFETCLRFNIKLIPSWIPREMNSFADDLSKTKDTDNWGIDYETFDYIQSKFGKFSFDRFADNRNRKVIKFNSRFHCENSTGVNAFTFDWSQEFNWLCPPICLIGETLRHLNLCKASGVLLVPYWPSSYFWPLLTQSQGKEFQSFIIDFLPLDPYYLNFSNCSSIFDGFTNFYSLALFIDFS